MLDFVWRCEAIQHLMPAYARIDGVLIAAVGHLWAVYSAASGETALLNDESAAVLEVLELGSCATEAVCSALAEDSGLDAAGLVDVVEACWPRLVEAGLVRELRPGYAKPQ